MIYPIDLRNVTHSAKVCKTFITAAKLLHGEFLYLVQLIFPHNRPSAHAIITTTEKISV